MHYRDQRIVNSMMSLNPSLTPMSYLVATHQWNYASLDSFSPLTPSLFPQVHDASPSIELPRRYFDQVAYKDTETTRIHKKAWVLLRVMYVSMCYFSDETGWLIFLLPVFQSRVPWEISTGVLLWQGGQIVFAFPSPSSGRFERRTSSSGHADLPCHAVLGKYICKIKSKPRPQIVSNAAKRRKACASFSQSVTF